jgi:hypothetical protein
VAGVAAFHVETIRDDGLYTGRCPNGHRRLVVTQTLRHEMLFEVALNALADGYNREAVSSFAASVERYYEFAIRVLAAKMAVKPAAFDSAWKKVARQSERQVGAFVFGYTMAFGEVPSIIEGKAAELRNAVTHKGKLTDKGEAIGFGEIAYGVIQDGIRELRARCIDDVNKMLGQQVAAAAAGLGKEYPRTFQVSPTALNVIEDISGGYKPFAALLASRGIAPLVT